MNLTLHLAGHKFCLIPTVLQMDPAKSAADNFGLIPANSRDRKSRADAPISIDSPTSPKIEELDGGAR